jgi:hypothetical protein
MNLLKVLSEPGDIGAGFRDGLRVAERILQRTEARNDGGCRTRTWGIKGNESHFRKERIPAV